MLTNLSELFERLMELLEVRPAGQFATFDLDNSLTIGDTAETLMAGLAREGYPRAEDVFKEYFSMLAAGDMFGAYKFGATAMAGIREEDVYDMVERTFRREGTEIGKTKLLEYDIPKGIALRNDVATLFHRLKASSRIEVWVITASPEPIGRAALEYFGLDADRVIGLRNIVKDGVITGELVPPLSIGAGKVECIQKYIHPTRRPILAVGDSLNDLPMLQYAAYEKGRREERGLPLVINRGNKLASIAVDRGWDMV